MSDFSALIASVESYIRQNGNNEITGNILQQVLMSIINTLGTQSINALETGLSTEQTTRANADTALGGRIDTEEGARQQADTALGGRIDGLVGTIGGVSGIVTTLQSRLDEGYIYKGIATPTTNPQTPTGKVFYVAVQAGTYTHFDDVEVANGITILTYDGEGWDDNNVITYDDEPTEGSTALPTSGGTHTFIKNNTLEETNAEIVDEGDIAEYLVDKNNACFGYIKKDGTVHLRHLSFSSTDNEIINRVSSPSPYDDPQVLKYLVDDNNICYGYIKKDGTVVINKAQIDILEGQIENAVTEEQLSAIVGLVAVGVDNIEMSNKPKMMEALNNLFTERKIEINAENQNKVNLKPCISIIDDDSIDDNIPSSHGSHDVGGYFSLLLPMLLSLGAKHGKHLVAGVAAEGHRIGLTAFHDDDDTYSELNQNGLLIKQLVEKQGWEVLNHSMVGSIPAAGRTFGVDSINSQIADTILANGTYVSNRAFNNTMVLDKSTGKWYQVNPTCTAWVEVPAYKYGQMYYQDYTTRKWYINRNFDWEYNWGEWFKRANELGLPFIKEIVHNGSTCTPVSILKSRNYAYCSYDIGGRYNYPPTSAAVKRQTGVEPNTNTNVPSQTWQSTFLNYVDTCIETKAWMPLMVHHNEERYYNGYRSGKTYENKDVEYEAGGSKYEWIHPLNETEILSMDANNYWTNPPARLGISSWDEWIPASGTQLRVLYDVLDYALTNGVDIIPPSEGWNLVGNIIQIGVDRNGQTYERDDDFADQFTDEEKSYLTIGGDMSIRYYNSKH